MILHECLHPWLLHTYLVLAWSLNKHLYIAVPWEFCAHRVLLILNMSGTARNGAHICCMHLLSCALFTAPYDFTWRHNSKDKIIRYFRIIVAEHWIKRGSLLNQGPVRQHRSHTNEAIKQWSVKISGEMFWSIKWNNLFQTFLVPWLCLYASESPKAIDLTLTPFSCGKSENFWGWNLRWIILFLAEFIGFVSMNSRDKHSLLPTNQISPEFIDVSANCQCGHGQWKTWWPTGSNLCTV